MVGVRDQVGLAERLGQFGSVSFCERDMTDMCWEFPNTKRKRSSSGGYRTMYEG